MKIYFLTVLIFMGMVTNANGRWGGLPLCGYPNPNNGIVNITQLVVDTNPIAIEILNDIGERVFKDKVVFVNGAAKLNISNRSPGLYLININDSKGGIYNLKFVLNK